MEDHDLAVADNDRRSKHRFAIERELRFKVYESDRVVSAGLGRTVDISSAGVAFRLAGRVTQGAQVQLFISWPVLLDETCHMQLFVTGRVVRAASDHAACTIDRYEFRTKSVANASQRGDRTTRFCLGAGTGIRLIS